MNKIYNGNSICYYYSDQYRILRRSTNILENLLYQLDSKMFQLIKIDAYDRVRLLEEEILN